MERFNRVIEYLSQYQQSEGDLALAQWRMEGWLERDLTVGIKDRQLGGAYDSPRDLDSFSAQLYLIWADGRISHGQVETRTLEEFPRQMEIWRRASYQDAEAPGVLGPDDFPQVDLAHHLVTRVCQEESAPLFELLSIAQEILEAEGIQTYDAKASASWGRQVIATSKGLRLETEMTSLGGSIDLEKAVSEWVASRQPVELAEWRTRVSSLCEVARAMRHSVPWQGGRQQVFLTPRLTEAFLDTFVLSNLSGQAVVNNQSAFALDQFGGEPLFHPDLSLSIDPLIPWALGSYPATREGVPARRQHLIQSGRLITPVLDLKYAKRTGMEPTPMPRTGNLRLELGEARSWEEAVAGIEQGILVYGVLGLHTQDAVRGDFSITAGQALAVEKGKILGKVSPVLSGNFFDVLRDSQTRPLRVAYQTLPGLAFEAQVIL